MAAGLLPPDHIRAGTGAATVLSGTTLRWEKDAMPHSEKDRLAAEFEKRWIDFEVALSDKRKYPVQQFRVAWEIGRRYAETTKNDVLIHRVVVSAVNGMTDYLTSERKRAPEEVVLKAQRLECLVFEGYDSYFEGNEPPGL
jgi:hypothetical protein